MMRGSCGIPGGRQSGSDEANRSCGGGAGADCQEGCGEGWRDSPAGHAVRRTAALRRGDLSLPFLFEPGEPVPEQGAITEDIDGGGIGVHLAFGDAV